ncbi:hypothetical protein LO762_12950 [Actinocorallia sp. API 0066]|uniref:hypothetical protein n=1 Tax=Actinocorallia sp. API 0066 TaxID=2896846 RepID=UPI001E61DC7C|nr:hypothetical protein [Actinocorallia sp. API 0066]MCD0450094.1 hypothetical protein [Actinocorallia sp. API 0066]
MIVLTSVGLCVVAFAAFQVFLAVRELAGAVEATRRRLDPRRSRLQRKLDRLRARMRDR